MTTKDFLFALICVTGFFAIISILLLFFAIVNLNGWMFIMALIPSVAFVATTFASVGWFNEHTTEKSKKN